MFVTKMNRTYFTVIIVLLIAVSAKSMETLPSEVVRITLDHLYPKYRQAVERTCKLWKFLALSLPQEPLSPRFAYNHGDTLVAADCFYSFAQTLEAENEYWAMFSGSVEQISRHATRLLQQCKGTVVKRALIPYYYSSEDIDVLVQSIADDPRITSITNIRGTHQDTAPLFTDVLFNKLLNVPQIREFWVIIPHDNNALPIIVKWLQSSNTAIDSLVLSVDMVGNEHEPTIIDNISELLSLTTCKRISLDIADLLKVHNPPFLRLLIGSIIKNPACVECDIEGKDLSPDHVRYMVDALQDAKIKFNVTNLEGPSKFAELEEEFKNDPRITFGKEYERVKIIESRNRIEK